MGGQGPKRISVPRAYSSYKSYANQSLKDEEIVHAAKTIAPLVGIITGSNEISAGIVAIADAYMAYKREGSASAALYAGGKSFILNTVPGYIASAAISGVETKIGTQIPEPIKTTLTSGIETGIRKISNNAFNHMEAS